MKRAIINLCIFMHLAHVPLAYAHEQARDTKSAIKKNEQQRSVLGEVSEHVAEVLIVAIIATAIIYPQFYKKILDACYTKIISNTR